VERGLLRRSTEKVKLVASTRRASPGPGLRFAHDDLGGQRVLEVVEERNLESTLKLWESLPKKQRRRVERWRWT